MLKNLTPFWLLVGTVFMVNGMLIGSIAQAGVRVQPNNLTYLGHFKVPDTNGACSDTPNARALGLTYDPSGNGGAGSFFIAGRQHDDCIAEINKPAVGGMASFLQPYTRVLNGTKDTIDDCYNGCFIGGNMLYGSNLYISAFSFYDAEGNQPLALWKRSRTLSSLVGFTGPSAVVSGQQGFTNAWMQEVPASLKASLGEAVIGGACWSIISRTSLGPALYSFNPNSLGTAIPLVHYPAGNQTLNPWGAPGSHPEANPTTKIGDMTFISDSDTVIFGGVTGKGDYCYGTGCYDPSYPGIQGAHAYPYVNYLWAYDVDDLAAAKAGTVQPYDVLPYAHWELGDFSASDEWSITGMAFDSATDRLYIMASRWPDGTASPAIHVYQVSGLAPDTTPPSSPTSLSATATSSSSITVSWTAATDNVGVANYLVERCQGSGCTNFTQVGTPSSSPFVDSGLTASTFYNYHVRATDAAGNLSGWSNVVGATTMAPDTIPPSTPTNLSATTPSPGAVSLSWTVSTDNVAVSSYKVERCQGSGCTTFDQVGTPISNSYFDTGLSASTLYRYQVRATDGTNNSGYSNIVNAMTPAGPNPIVSYNFNEGSGTTSSDLSGNNYTATLTNGTAWTASKTNYGQALSFDGVDDAVTVVNSSGLNFGTSDFTFEAWVNRNVLGGGQRHIFSKCASVWQSGCKELYFNASNQLVFGSHATGDTSSISLADTAWHHIAVTFADSSNTITFFVDGAQQTTATKALEADGAGHSVTLGNLHGNNPFSGLIDDVRIYASALSLSQIQVDMNTPVGSSPPDTTPPTSPSNLAANATSQSSITVTWSAATDDVGVTGYTMERCQGSSCSNFTQVGTPSGSPFVDSGLTANTFYNYHVRAVDGAGNLSGWSNVVGATTQTGGGGRTISVHTLSELYTAFSSEQANDTIVIYPDGSPYTLNTVALAIDQPGVTVRGSTGNRNDVVIRGDAMSSGALIKIVFLIDADAADTITIKDLSVGRVGWHAIKFSGENNAGDNSVIDNVRIFDAYEQLLKASDTDGTATDAVTVKNSLFEYTAGVGPQYYIGGIDAHRATGWIVQDNTFRDIQSPSGSVAEHAIHLWDDTAGTGNNTVERNTIINCDRGIGLWLNSGGTIRNNMILHDGSGAYPDVAIDIQDSPNVKIYNNTSWIAASGYYTNIELRGATSTGLVLTNNLMNKGIGNISAPSPTLTSNITTAQASWFVNVANDLHLASSVSSVVNQGVAVSGLTDDFDKQSRPQGGGIDIGADEYVSGGAFTPCNTVTTANFSQSVYNSYGAPFDAFQTSTNLISANCNSADTHTIQATLGQTGDTTRIVYTKGYYYAGSAWTQYTGTCTGALNGEWCQGSVSATIANPNLSTASAASPAYFVGMTCSVQGGGWKCGCRDTTCANFYWQVQGAGQ